MRSRHAALPSLALLALLSASASTASADGAPKGPNRSSVQGHTSVAAETTPPVTFLGGKAPEKPPLPVKLTVTAPTPDPPWTMRLENTGEHPIRIAADVRLLSFELETKGGTKKCTAPAGLRPTKLLKSRELYLKPGEAFQQEFDPRLYCFGTTGDALTNATVVHAHYGFAAPSWGQSKGPFAAQGIDEPAEFAALPTIDATDVQLAYATFAPPPPPAPAEPAPTHASLVAPSAPPPEPESFFIDKNKARFTVFVDRFSDVNAARDIVVNVHLKNEGTHEMIAALRGRMVSFVVEQLGRDGSSMKTVDCTGEDQTHPISAEMLRGLGGGQSVTIPLLVAEVCPPSTFDRPGLYRVTPRLDTLASGEAAELEAYVGRAFTRDAVLVRVATAREPFEDSPPAVYVPPPPPPDPKHNHPGKHAPN
ncbi:MAG: hypothetical protein U0414_05410 [Polyangiaceae bacterium]